MVSREGARALLYSGLPLRGPLDIHLDSVAAEEEEVGCWERGVVWTGSQEVAMGVST